MTLDIVLTTDKVPQTGPARIFSFSLDGSKRNMSLCQEKAHLVLRLRTTQTGLNGIKPEVRLCAIEAKQKIHVLITYQPGKLGVRVDGKDVDVQQIGGDFSNWEEYGIVIGNEWQAERKWHGLVERFMFSSAHTRLHSTP